MSPRSEKERALAEKLFVCDGKSGREIAGILGAGKETIRRWAHDGRWVARRRLRRAESQMAAVEILRRERDRLIRGLGAPQPEAAEKVAGPSALGTMETINAVLKLTQTIEKMDPQPDEDNLDSMVAAMSRYGAFVAARADANDRIILHKWLERFWNEERRKSVSG